MYAHAENAETGSVGNQGTAGPSWSESALRPPRYDEDTREHLKTVELIVQRRSRAASRAASPASGSLERGAESNGSRKPGGWAAVAATRKVALRIGLRERDLQRRVKSAGGRWDPDRRVWFVRRDVAERLDLLGRVVGGGV